MLGTIMHVHYVCKAHTLELGGCHASDERASQG